MHQVRKFFSEKTVLLWILIVVVLFHVFYLLYINQHYFFEQYDISYWKDRFEHSQWQLPASKRILGDDGLFAYVGYRLMQGADLSLINPETPPVSKYFIGLSLILFQNPIYYALFFGIGSCVLFYVLANKVLKDSNVAFFITILFFLDPLFFTQFWKAWVDIGQLFWLLLNIVLLVYGVSYKKHRYIFFLASGVALGLFAMSKVPILLPIILLLECFYLFYKQMVKAIGVFVFAVAITIFAVHIQYFLLGHSIIDFLKYQKFVFSFFQQSRLVPHLGAAWVVLLSGRFPDLVTGVLTQVSEWSPLWSLLTVSSVIFSIVIFFKRTIDVFWKGVAFYIFLSIIVFSFIPFYTRYLLIVLPFLYLLFAKVVKEVRISIRQPLMYLCLGIGSLAAFFFLLPSPEETLHSFYYSLSNQYFHDIFQENIVKSNKSELTRDKFRILSQAALVQAEVKEMHIKEIARDVPIFGDKGWVKIRVLYKTQNLGAFSEEKTLQLQKVHQQWKIVWGWDLVLNNFRPGYSLQTEIITGKRGSIVTKDNNILVEDTSGYLISVNPEKINPESEPTLLAYIGKIGGVKAVNLHNAYNENVLPHSYIPLVTTFEALSVSQKKELLSFSGVKLTPYQSREYRGISPTSIKNTFYNECCTRIYSSYNYQGISGTEKEKNASLVGYDGGRLVINNEKGDTIRVVISKNPKNGQDIIIN